MKRPIRAVMADVTVDRGTRVPVQRQLYEQLRHAILSFELPPGACLPSTRTLAGRLGLSRNTIIAAYENLAADGLVITHTGCGTRVRTVPMPPPTMSLPDIWTLLRQGHFPATTARTCDPDGTPLIVQS